MVGRRGGGCVGTLQCFAPNNDYIFHFQDFTSLAYHLEHVSLLVRVCTTTGCRVITASSHARAHTQSRCEVMGMGQCCPRLDVVVVRLCPTRTNALISLSAVGGWNSCSLCVCVCNSWDHGMISSPCWMMCQYGIEI